MPKKANSTDRGEILGIRRDDELNSDIEFIRAKNGLKTDSAVVRYAIANQARRERILENLETEHLNIKLLNQQCKNTG